MPKLAAESVAVLNPVQPTTAGPGGGSLPTEQVPSDLGRRAISSGVITITAQAAKFVLNLAGAVVLARLLTPQEFGLVAMASAVTVFLGLFKDAGLSTATVQRKSITQAQISNLFWINVGLGAAISLLGLIVAPAVAWFYNDGRLVTIMVALSLTFFLTGSMVQHRALLIREMRFKAVAIIEVGSALAGLAAACVLALAGFGYWSLVGMQLGIAAAGLVLTWWASKWRPALPSRGSGVSSLLRFGAHLTGAGLISRFAWGCDTLLIGRFFGATAVGLYSRAQVLLVRPLDQVLLPTDSVIIPVLSRLQSDHARYRRTFLRVYNVLAIVTFGLAALLLALSRPIVLTLLGPAWEVAVVLFAGFTLAALYMPLSYAATWLVTSQGRGRDWLQINIVLSAVTLLSYVVGLPYGPFGVVMSYAASGLFLRLPILYYLAGRIGPVRQSDLWRGFLGNVPCWAGVYCATSLAQVLIGPVAPWMELLICAPAGLAGGGLAIFLLEGPRETALYAVKTFRDWFSRR
jgi:PST family polysaccharide transporter